MSQPNTSLQVVEKEVTWRGPLCEFAEDRPPWAMQTEEPPQWFDRFEVYRSLKSTQRSVRKAYVAAGGPPNAIVPGSWSKASTEWRWKERALAFDAHERKRKVEEAEAERREERDLRIATLRELRFKLLEAIKVLKPEEAKWSEVISGLQTVHKELRLEFGEDPNGTEDRPFVVKVLRGVSMDEI